MQVCVCNWTTLQHSHGKLCQRKKNNYDRIFRKLCFIAVSYMRVELKNRHQNDIEVEHTFVMIKNYMKTNAFENILFIKYRPNLILDFYQAYTAHIEPIKCNEFHIYEKKKRKKIFPSIVLWLTLWFSAWVSHTHTHVCHAAIFFHSFLFFFFPSSAISL